MIELDYRGTPSTKVFGQFESSESTLCQPIIYSCEYTDASSSLSQDYCDYFDTTNMNFIYFNYDDASSQYSLVYSLDDPFTITFGTYSFTIVIALGDTGTEPSTTVTFDLLLPCRVDHTQVSLSPLIDQNPPERVINFREYDAAWQTPATYTESLNPFLALYPNDSVLVSSDPECPIPPGEVLYAFQVKKTWLGDDLVTELSNESQVSSFLQDVASVTRGFPDDGDEALNYKMRREYVFYASSWYIHSDTPNFSVSMFYQQTDSIDTIQFHQYRHQGLEFDASTGF